MFKVLIIACSILPYPRGEILNSKCYYVEDKWQPPVYGYPSRKQCINRIDKITLTIKKNFDLLELKKYHCEQIGDLS